MMAFAISGAALDTAREQTRRIIGERFTAINQTTS